MSKTKKVQTAVDQQIARIEEVRAHLDGIASKRMSSVLKDFKSGSKRTERKIRKLLLAVDAVTVMNVMIQSLKEDGADGD